MAHPTSRALKERAARGGGVRAGEGRREDAGVGETGGGWRGVAKAEWRPARGFWTFWSSRSTGERKASPTLQFRGPVHDCLLECSECRPGLASCHCSHAFRPIWEVRIAGLSWRVDFLSVRAKLYRNSSVQNNILN